MPTQTTHHHPQPNDPNTRPPKLVTCLHLSGSPNQRRPVRISFPVPRRESCLNRRVMRAALREAEFKNWFADDGEDVICLMSNH